MISLWDCCLEREIYEHFQKKSKVDDAVWHLDIYHFLFD